MNYLAHAWLAAEHPSEAFRLGNLMADHIKGPPERALAYLKVCTAQAQADVLAGIRYHRAIDRAVDHDADVVALRRSFRAEYRRYAGIVLDMAWDYQLASRWPDYHEQPLPHFAAGQYQLLASAAHLQPESMRFMVQYMVRHDWLVSYQHFAGIQAALAGMSRRIKRDNRLADAGVEIQRLEPELSLLFPLVMARLGQQPFDKA